MIDFEAQTARDLKMIGRALAIIVGIAAGLLIVSIIKHLLGG